MIVYRCEDSLESIFTAIYNAYEDGRKPEDTMLRVDEELLLFAEYVSVETDVEKAEKVIRTLRQRFGEEDYEKLCLALASTDSEKAQAVYQTVAAGLKKKLLPGHLLDNLSNHWKHRVFSLARGVGNECCHLRGFVRFQELENGIMYSEIAPKNQVLTFLMPHFTDRFPGENFMIYDENHNLFGVHPAGREWYLMTSADVEGMDFALSKEEQDYQELFCWFCHKIAIRERRNLELQRNMLPLRFRGYMVEFVKKL